MDSDYPSSPGSNPGSIPGSNAGTTATATVAADTSRRITRRKTLKRGVDVSVRKGTLGLGPNLAVAGLEISDDGIQVRIRSELKPGDEVEVRLTGIGRSKPVPLIADVRWCRPDDADPNGKMFLLGAMFRHRLTHAQLAEFI
jgi:hypothetical protein